MALVPEPVPEDPIEWLECLRQSFTVSEEGELVIALKTAVDTLGTIEQLGAALVMFFEHQLPDPTIRAKVAAIRGEAGDAYFYMVDEGDHG